MPEQYTLQAMGLFELTKDEFDHVGDRKPIILGTATYALCCRCSLQDQDNISSEGLAYFIPSTGEFIANATHPPSQIALKLLAKHFQTRSDVEDICDAYPWEGKINADCDKILCNARTLNAKPYEAPPAPQAQLAPHKHPKKMIITKNDPLFIADINAMLTILILNTHQADDCPTKETLAAFTTPLSTHFVIALANDSTTKEKEQSKEYIKSSVKRFAQDQAKKSDLGYLKTAGAYLAIEIGVRNLINKMVTLQDEEKLFPLLQESLQKILPHTIHMTRAISHGTTVSDAAKDTLLTKTPSDKKPMLWKRVTVSIYENAVRKIAAAIDEKKSRI